MKMSSRILFLDFDGVVNTYCVADMTQDCVMIYDQATTDLYSAHLSKNVERLCKKYDLSIVISSSWREFYSLHELEYMLRYMGITAKLIGVTTSEHLDTTYRERLKDDIHSLSYDRGMQITDWLEHHTHLDIEGYIVLDDNLYARYGHDDHFIHCDRDIGFDDAAYERGIQICDTIFKSENVL